MTEEQADALERMRDRVPEILEVLETGKFPRHLMDAMLLDTAICGVPDEAADDLRATLTKLPMVPAMRGKADELLNELVRVAAAATHLYAGAGHAWGLDASKPAGPTSTD